MSNNTNLSKGYKIPALIFGYSFSIVFLLLAIILGISFIFIEILYPISWVVVVIGIYICVRGYIYPFKKWILDNIRCPQCGSKFAECEINFESPFKVMMAFKVYCKSCQIRRILETGTFGRTLKFITPHEVKVEIIEKTSTFCPLGHIDLESIKVKEKKKSLKELSGINFCIDKKIAKNIEIPTDISSTRGELFFYISEDRPDCVELSWETYNPDTYKNYIKNMREKGPAEGIKNIEIKSSEEDLQFENRDITGKQIIFRGKLEDVEEEFFVYRTVLKCSNHLLIIIRSICGASCSECHDTHKEILNTLTCQSIEKG